jgi:DNA-binding PadR family transcriptional regulator
LEQKGLVTSKLGESTPERGGRAKRYFRLKAAGLKALRESRAMFLNLWRDYETILDRA